MVVREPAARLARLLICRSGPPLEAPRARGERAAHRKARRGDQRVRLRAGVLQERAARARRLYGLGDRRRGDAAREPRGLFQILSAAAAPERRVQGGHERRHPRGEVSEPDLHLPDGRQQGLSPGRRGGGRARGEDGRAPRDARDPRDHFDGGGDRGARSPGLVPALRLAQVGSRRSAGQARRARRVAGRRGDGGPRRGEKPGNLLSPAQERRARVQRLPLGRPAAER